ncbi:transcriptional regulator [Streptomyces carpinensis]|uniref:Transcriptional regulator n=1 Tax=Streptomyces carpinensis TaxID=66369 RepID=A0ABV1W1I6_9ACTN|nr:transcriptional regulator [Streptomyces carpinensis]
MRSVEDSPHESRAKRQAQAQRVGAYLTGAATAAGYDVRRRQGGRAQLAAATGLSLTTISRTLDGKTLPLPSQLTTWATVLNLDHRRILVESGLIPEQRGPQSPRRGPNSATLSPDEAMTAWGITDPIIRRTLNGSIVHAIELQAEIDAAQEPGPLPAAKRPWHAHR